MAKLKDEIRKRKPFAVLEEEAFLNVMRTADALSRQAEGFLQEAGLSKTQYNVLRILRGAGGEGLACGQIIERMITRDPDMTRLLDRLEKRELISRAHDTADRRIVKAKISSKGLAILATLDQPLPEMHRLLLGHMGKERLRQLIALLEEARSGPKDLRITCEGR